MVGDGGMTFWGELFGFEVDASTENVVLVPGRVLDEIVEEGV